MGIALQGPQKPAASGNKASTLGAASEGTSMTRKVGNTDSEPLKTLVKAGQKTADSGHVLRKRRLTNILKNLVRKETDMLSCCGAGAGRPASHEGG